MEVPKQLPCQIISLLALRHCWCSVAWWVLWAEWLFRDNVLVVLRMVKGGGSGLVPCFRPKIAACEQSCAMEMLSTWEKGARFQRIGFLLVDATRARGSPRSRLTVSTRSAFNQQESFYRCLETATHQLRKTLLYSAAGSTSIRAPVA